ncbi:hypothetical protein [Nocardia cyriacigeorgica]|uniref:hypothetical protein n=1 Tax=Nocardia cyriacigeorgica TaxID=135487 RepID=UPI0024566975|nr:hypothetical protein [Nocardia cyriacigeorgica]
MSIEFLDKQFRRAAESVTYSWPGVIAADDITQELWVWYLTSPAVQRKLAGIPAHEVFNIAIRQGHNIASAGREANARFSTQVQYSVEDIEKALASNGKGVSREMADDLASGLKGLDGRTARHREAIEARYIDGVMPEDDAARMRLTRAVAALTEETNRAVRAKFERYEAAPGKTLGDGPGTKRVVFPDDTNHSRSIFDSEWNGIPGIDMYRSWVVPELYPDERPARIENWHEDERADYGAAVA